MSEHAEPLDDWEHEDEDPYRDDPGGDGRAAAPVPGDDDDEDVRLPRWNPAAARPAGPRSPYPGPLRGTRATVPVQHHLWRHCLESGALALVTTIFLAAVLPRSVPLWSIIVIGLALTAVTWFTSLNATGSLVMANYLMAWGVLVTGWLSAAHLVGVWHPHPAVMITTLLAPGLVLSALGAVAIGHHRDAIRRDALKHEALADTAPLRRWERTLARHGVPHTTILDVIEHKSGVTEVHGRLGKATDSRRAVTRDVLEAAAIPIAVSRRLPEDAISFERPKGGSAADFIMHVKTRSGPRTTVFLPRDNKPTTVNRPFPIGVMDNGKKFQMKYREVAVLVIGVRGSGKALALDTPVATPSGWTTMGELKPGDQVFDEAGRPCRVTFATEVMHGHPCYRVRFSDGTEIIADADHQWLADTGASRRSANRARRHGPGLGDWRDQSAKRNRPVVITTAQMIPGLRELKRSSWSADGGQNNYSIRVAAPLQCPEADLPVAPYTLGAWLGDGATVTGSITTADPEIITEIEREGETAWVVPSTVKPTMASYRVKGLNVRLRAIGVLGSKHIPDTYQRASESQRRALLAGLLDTDGHCTKSGSVEFCSTREQLARDTYRLVCGLGYKASLRSKPAMLYGKDCGTCWTVAFTPAEKVFRLPRKLARQVTRVRSTAAHRYITAIDPVPSVPVRCIQVDSPNSLYLAGEACVPTHNTNLINIFIAQLARCIDAVVFMIDLKGGRAARPWMMPWVEGHAPRPVIDWLATTREEAMLMLEALLAGGMARARSGDGWDKITPSADVPAVILVCDETAVMTGHGIRADGISNFTMAQLLAQFVETYRSEAMDLLCAALRGNVDIMGSTAVKAMTEVRIGLRVTSSADGDSVFPDDHAMAKALARLRDQGDGLVKVGPDMSPTVHFYRIGGERQIRDIALSTGNIRPAPEDRLVAAMGPAYAERWTRQHGQDLLKEWRSSVGLPEPPERDEADPFWDIVAHQEDPEKPVDPRRAKVRRYLYERGDQGYTVGRLVTMLASEGLTCPRETIQRWLADDEEKGLVQRTGKPLHRWVWHAAQDPEDIPGMG